MKLFPVQGAKCIQESTHPQQVCVGGLDTGSEEKTCHPPGYTLYFGEPSKPHGIRRRTVYSLMPSLALAYLRSYMAATGQGT